MGSVDWGQLQFGELSWWPGPVPSSEGAGTSHVHSGFQEIHSLGVGGGTKGIYGTILID